MTLSLVVWGDFLRGIVSDYLSILNYVKSDSVFGPTCEPISLCAGMGLRNLRIRQNREAFYAESGPVVDAKVRHKAGFDCATAEGPPIGSKYAGLCLSNHHHYLIACDDAPTKRLSAGPSDVPCALLSSGVPARVLPYFALLSPTATRTIGHSDVQSEAEEGLLFRPLRKV